MDVNADDSIAAMNFMPNNHILTNMAKYLIRFNTTWPYRRVSGFG